MPPVIILDTSRVRPGRLDAVRGAFDELARFVEASEPRVHAYAVYIDADRSLVTVLQLHPDAESAEYHMEVGGPQFRKFSDLLELQVIHVYGEPSDRLLARLEDKSDMLRGSGVLVHGLHAGFSRLPQSAAPAGS